MRYFFFFFISALALIRCSQSPRIPDLPKSAKTPVEQVILSSDLSVKDVRNLFRALNHEGKLNSLQPWIESPADPELQELGVIIKRHLYEENLDRNGLVSLLETRKNASGFSDWKNSAVKWRNNPNFILQRSFLEKWFAHRAFPRLVEGEIQLLDPVLFRAIERLRSQANSQYEHFATFPVADPVSDEVIARDLMTFITDDSQRALLVTLIEKLSIHRFPESFLHALASLQQTYGDARAVDGFVLGHGQRIVDKKLDSLLLLLETLNAPSDGLFEVAAEKLKSPGVAQELSKRFNKTIAQAVARFVMEKFSTEEASFLRDKNFWLKLPRKDGTLEPTPEFVQLYGVLQWGVEQLRSQTQGPTFTRFPVQLASIVFTEWLEHFAKNNSIFFAGLKPESFPSGIWKLPVSVPELRLSLVNEPDPEKKNDLSPRLIADLNALKVMSAFRDGLQAALKDTENPFGSKVYSFLAHKNHSFENVLSQVAQILQDKVQIADPGPLFISLLGTFLDAKDFSLQSMERENLLHSALNALQAVDYKSWKGLKSLLFEKLQLGKLPESDREMLLYLYEGHPTLSQKLGTILDTLQSFYDYDENLQNLPSAFETCHRLLRKTNPDDVGGLSSVLSFLFHSQLVGTSPEKEEPYFPGISQLVKTGRSLSRSIFLVSLSTLEEQEAILPLLKKIMWNDHLSPLAEIAQESKPEILTALKTVLQEGLSLIPTEKNLSKKERGWLMRFFSSEGEHQKFWQFLHAHSSRKNLLQLSHELLVLSQSGALKDALLHLSHIENERIQRLAFVFLDLQKSGQLEEALHALETVLRD